MIERIIEFCAKNRLLVLMQWFYSYATFNRGARLITGNKDQLTPVT